MTGKQDAASSRIPLPDRPEPNRTAPGPSANHCASSCASIGAMTCQSGVSLHMT